MCVSIISEAQIPDWEWAKNIGSFGDDMGRSIATDYDGNVYITGTFLNSSITFDSITINNNGLRNIFLAKYAPNGNIIWAKSAGGNNYDYSCNVTTDNSGNVYVTGYFQSDTIIFYSDTLINNGTADIFLAKYDSDGNVLWAKSAGKDSYDHSYSVTADTSDNVYITGDFRSDSIIFDTIILINNNGGSDAFLAKYSADGDIIWAKNVGVNGEDAGNDIICDLSNNVYLTGQFRSDSIIFGSTILNNNGSDDIFLVKYNSDGNVLWAKKAGNTDSDIGKSVTADTSGNIYLTGYFESNNISFGAINLTINGTYGYPNTDVFIAKYAPNGTALWAKNAGNSGTDKGTGITTNISNNIFISGNFNSSSITFGSTVLTNNGGYDMFVVKYAPTGNVVWAKSVGSDEEESSNGIAVNALNLYMTGYFQSDIISFYSDTLINNGFYDIFIAKLSECTISVFIGNDTTICKNDSIILNPGAGFTSYLWQDASTNQTFIADTTGTYYVMVTDNYDCVAYDTINIIVSSPVIDLGQDAGLCDGNILILDAENPGSLYLWNDSTTNQTLDLDTSGTYYVQVTDINNCSASDTITISVNPLPNVNLGNDTNFCNGNILTLDAENPGSLYLWNDSTTNQTFDVDTSGTYYVQVTDTNNCFASDTILISVNPLPYVDLGNDTGFCDGNILTLDAENFGSSYLWNDSTTNKTLDVHTSGTYYVQVTDTNNCAASDTILISVNPLPYVDLGQDTVTICNDSYVILYAGTGFDIYEWSDSSNLDSLKIDGALVGISSEFYSVTVTDSNDCQASDSVFVIVEICGEIAHIDNNNITVDVFPNPSKDVFTILINNNTSKQYNVVSLSIVDTYGKLIYKENLKNIPKNYTKQIDLSDFSQGTYFLKLISDNQIIKVKKLLLK